MEISKNMKGIFSGGFIRIQKYSSKITLAGEQFEIQYEKRKLRPCWCVALISFAPLCKRRKLKLVISVQTVNSATLNLFGVAIR